MTELSVVTATSATALVLMIVIAYFAFIRG
jgi:hypothetical protein